MSPSVRASWQVERGGGAGGGRKGGRERRSEKRERVGGKEGEVGLVAGGGWCWFAAPKLPRLVL